MKRAIVCGIDGSPDSQAALAYANDLAERLETRLVLAHVGEGDAGEAAGEQLLGAMASAVGIDHAERRVVTGIPAERLADLADEENAQLIVVGSRGRGPLRAALLGSVSMSVINLARCPVVVVPPGAMTP